MSARKAVLNGPPDKLLDDSGLAHIAGYTVVKANLALREAFRQAIGKAHDISPVEFTLLTLLAGNQQVTLKALAASLALRAPNLTVIVSRLTKRGLLSSSRNEQDARSVLIGLSPAGETMQASALEISYQMEDHALSALSRDERSKLLKLLNRIRRP